MTEPRQKKKMSTRQRKRVAVWSVLAIIGLSLVLPLGSYTVHWLGSSAVAQEKTVVNPRSDLWRAIGDGAGGYSAIKGPGANTLVQRGGNAWRELRNGPLIQQYMPWALAGMAALIVLYHIIRGRNRLEHAPSGRKVKRWAGFERLVHWFTAITFIILAITGLSMLFGRTLMIPLLGKEGFALWANASITVHNVVGPAFSIGVALMLIMWVWYNFPTVTDLKWFAKGGGLFGKAHPSAGRFNGGEKVWFWLLATVGVAVCLSGLVLVAPIYGFEVPIVMEVRALMQQANLIHAVAALAWTTVAIGHIYIGTAGTEGAFEGMATGYVSEEWARQHHDLWYEQMAESGKAEGYVSREDLDVMRRQQSSRPLAT